MKTIYKNPKTAILSFLFLLIFTSVKSQQWQNITPSEYPYVFGFSFINPNQGWIRAYKELSSNEPERLLYTPDGGQTFDLRYTFDEVDGFMSLQMVDSLNGYGLVIRDDNFFWHTTDGGYTWQDITDTTFMKKYGYVKSGASIYFLNQDTGFIADLRYIYKTTNGGQTWDICYTPPVNTGNSNYLINEIHFYNEKYGWAVCTIPYGHGFGMKTTDGGMNWAICTSTDLPDMADVDCNDSLICGMVGNNSFNRRVELTEDNFESLSYIFGDDFNILTNTIAYQNDSSIWLAGVAGMIKNSTDRGATFVDYLPGNIPVDNTIIYKLRFLENIGYAYGEHNGNENRFLLKYIDTLNTSLSKPLLANLSIIVSPNPVIDKCNVSVKMQKSEMATIEILSINGLVLLRKEQIMYSGKNQFSLDLEHLKPGLCFLSIKNSSEIITAKFILNPK
jgi:photosystem II stability/assembly factor-like uncharacterized protein